MKKGGETRKEVGVNSWLTMIAASLENLGQESKVFVLGYETDSLIQPGISLRSIVTSYDWNFIKIEIYKGTILATLHAALWPVYLLNIATSIDNPLANARTRCEKERGSYFTA